MNGDGLFDWLRHWSINLKSRHPGSISPLWLTRIANVRTDSKMVYLWSRVFSCLYRFWLRESVVIPTLAILELMMFPSPLAARHSMENCLLPLQSHQHRSLQPHGLISVAVLNSTVQVKALPLAYPVHRWHELSHPMTGVLHAITPFDLKHLQDLHTMLFQRWSVA